MSQIEHLKGKLVEVKPKDKESLEDIAKRICETEGYEKLDHYDTYLEFIEEDWYDKYLKIEDKLFKIESEQVEEDGDIRIANVNEDGNIEFEVRYYNGGCCLTEAIEDSIKDMKK